MRTFLWLGLLCAGIAGATPYLAKAQIFSDPCCGTCQLPVVQCHCQRTRPVLQTQYREERITTYRNVAETRYRNECIVEQKPVTTYEDRVETVLVPQQVTRRVAKTVMVPQTRMQSVPYQVMHQVPQTTSRLVPYQTVHHVTETVPMTFVGGVPLMNSTVAIPAPTTTASIPTMPPINVPTPQAAGTPRRAPPLTPTVQGWETIPARSAGRDRPVSYESNAEAYVPTPIGDEPAVRRSSWRGHVPGAAAAWNYNESTLR